MATAMGVSRLVENAKYKKIACAFFHLHAHDFTSFFFLMLLVFACQ